MIKDNFVEVIGHSRNKKYYTDLGYDVIVGESFFVNPKHLSKGSTFKITTICENCSKESLNVFKDYWNYTKGFKEPYFCTGCKKIKSEKTSLKNWGFKNPMQNEKVKDILRNSLIEKYGVSWYSKTDEWLSKFKKTSLDKWGYDNPSKNPLIINDIRDKNINFLKSEEFRVISKEKKQRNTWKKYKNLLPDNYSVIGYDTDVFTLKHHDCESDFKLTKGLLYSRLKTKSIICIECNPIDVNKSSFEEEIGLFLKEIGVDFEKGNRSILSGLELDYLIPHSKVAIECNGVWWHNELFKSSNYHINKTKMCLEKEIQLLHIWEDDWFLRKDIIKSIIKNKLGLIDKNIWARSCVIKEVKTSEYRSFLEKNHIQGYASSSYNIGLYYNDELVSLMTFGWRRTNNKREYELIRFCNKLDHSVVGSASKLFKYFLKNTEILELTSYSDISLFSGELYAKLGFIKSGLSKPNYFWVVSGIRKHRYNFSKRKLIKEGYDKNKTEVEIMNDRGYWRIFSTGQEKWIYKR